jgi:hypothetical protein
LHHSSGKHKQKTNQILYEPDNKPRLDH